MSISSERAGELTALCRQFRIDVIDLLYSIQTGHPGGSLSVCEILAALYLEKANITTQNADSNDRDRVILTKGHAAPMLYRILAEKGFIQKEELKTLRQINSRLQGHPNAHDTPGVELSTGPLGIGLSAAVGIAAAQRLDKNGARVFAVMGDGELDEGVVWEACMSAHKFGLDNLTIIVDNNGVQLDGTNDEIMPLLSLKAKFSAFGLNVIECDGHSISELCNSIDCAKATTGVPTVILAKTVKGKGVSFMEGKNIWHGAPIKESDYTTAMAELRN